MKNWKTTFSGVALIISGVSLYINQPDKIQEAFALVIAGLGLIFAKDGNGTAKGIVGDRPPGDGGR